MTTIEVAGDGDGDDENDAFMDRRREDGEPASSSSAVSENFTDYVYRRRGAGEQFANANRARWIS